MAILSSSFTGFSHLILPKIEVKGRNSSALTFAARSQGISHSQNDGRGHRKVWRRRKLVEFDPVHGSILQRREICSLDNAISDLLREETHLAMLKGPHIDVALSTSASKSNSSPHDLYCKYYYSQGHKLLKCFFCICKVCKKTVGHYLADFPKLAPQLSRGQSNMNHCHSRGYQSRNQSHYKLKNSTATTTTLLLLLHLQLI